MNLKMIPLSLLMAHPLHIGAMSLSQRAKLRRHIERTGLYEPLIVRPLAPRPGYQLLNGHQRKAILEQLGRPDAACAVWELGDVDALLYLAVRNRLTGREDPYKRALLLEYLTRQLPPATLKTLLPETPAQLQKSLAALEPPPKAPAPVRERFQPLTFFVNAAQRRLIEQALRQTRQQTAGDDPQHQLSRGDLLAALIYKAHLPPC